MESFLNLNAAIPPFARDRATGMSGVGLSTIPSMTWGSALSSDAVLGGTRRVPAVVANHPYRSTVAALAKQGAPPRGEPR